MIEIYSNNLNPRLQQLRPFTSELCFSANTQQTSKSLSYNAKRRVVFKITFGDVSFAYMREQIAFDCVLFVVPLVSSAGIVGPSRCGKSAVTRLFLGLYQPTGGKTLIDSQDVWDLDLQILRRRIGVVP